MIIKHHNNSFLFWEYKNTLPQIAQSPINPIHSHSRRVPLHRRTAVHLRCCSSRRLRLLFVLQILISEVRTLFTFSNTYHSTCNFMSDVVRKSQFGSWMYLLISEEENPNWNKQTNRFGALLTWTFTWCTMSITGSGSLVVGEERRRRKDGAFRWGNHEALQNQEDGDADAEGQGLPCRRLRDQHLQTRVQEQIRRKHEEGRPCHQ